MKREQKLPSRAQKDDREKKLSDQHPTDVILGLNAWPAL